MRQVRSEKAKKQVAMTAITSILQPESVVTDLIIQIQF